MTPSLPTFFMASAMMPPICLSLFALIVPTCVIISPLTSLWSFLTSSTATSTARSMPRLGHRTCACCHCLYAFAENGLREHGCGGRAVAGNVRGLGSDLAHHLRAHIFERVLQFDFLCNGDAILGDDRRAELLLNHCVAALRAERDLDGVRQEIDAPQNGLAGMFARHNLLCCHDYCSSL